MKIAGIEKCSFVDWPGMIAAVVFTPGCNLDCFYCHNKHIVSGRGKYRTVPTEAVMNLLAERRGFLDGVVISGGEPTLQPDLRAFLSDVRDMGYRVKLDTNGTYPGILAQLLDEGLLDYVAMDVKAPQDKYDRVCGISVDHSAINASIDRLLSGRADYEFRTTIAPQLGEDDIVAIARRIRGAKRYILQQYRRPPQAGPAGDPRLEEPPHSVDWVLGVIKAISGMVQRVESRGFGIIGTAEASTAA